MAVQLATTLYPVNTTTVDSGGAVDVRFLDTATGSADTTTRVAFSHTNDNAEHTFDPATNSGSTNGVNAGTTLAKLGWALRLANEMTPTDDTNYDAFLSAQTIAVSLVMTADQTGGTYASGTFQPTFRASLWRYNPATDTGTLIAAGSSNSVTWNVANVGGDLGTAKTVTFNIVCAATVFGAAKGTAAEIFYLQVGLNTGTVPNPTLGTASYTVIFTVGTANTNVGLGVGLTELGYMVGSSSGVGAAAAAGAPVYPTVGSAAGTGSASGAFLAFELATGTATGVGTAAGAFGAVKLGTGSAAGAGAASGSAAVVKPTVGTVDVGAGGGTTIVKRPLFLFDD